MNDMIPENKFVDFDCFFARKVGKEAKMSN